MVEPRRVATRAAAARMAAILGERVGETIGYAVRFERVVSSKTQTKSSRKACSQQTVERSEFTRRLVRRVRRVSREKLRRGFKFSFSFKSKEKFGRMQDLKVYVMSATLGDVATRCRELMRRTLRRNENGYDAPIVKSEGKSFPVETIYVGGGSTSGAYNNDSVEDTAVKTVQRALSDTIRTVEIS